MCKSNLDIYLSNSRECYCLIEWLANCIAKRIKRGKEVNIDYLANCSTMSKIIRVAKKLMVLNNEQIKPTKEDIKEMRQKVAKEILEDYVPYL